jgi:hypothetical protein
MMKPPRTFSLTICLLSALLFGGLTAFAQSPGPKVEASYEVVLQLVVGSNEGSEGAALPANLRGMSGQLKNNFGFSNYRLDNTFVGRIAANGTFDYKSVSNSFGSGVDAETPSFLEWTLGRLISSTDDKGQATVQAQPFRFGAKVPIKVSTLTDGGTKTVSNTSYESIGLTVNQVSLAQNTPTLIGSLSLPKTAGTIFLVLTVRPAI